MRLSQLPQLRNLLLLVLLLLLCAYTILASFLPLASANGESFLILLTKAHYASFGAVAACFLSYFVIPRFFRRVLGVTLLLAVFGLVNFLPSAISIGITLGDLYVGLNPLFLLLLVVFYFLNRTSASAFVSRYILPAPTPKQAAARQREAIDQFKQTFARKTDDSLLKIVQDRRLVADAVTAAQELLAKRQALQSART